jgi:hypothetical protein
MNLAPTVTLSAAALPRFFRNIHKGVPLKRRNAVAAAGTHLPV